MTRHLSALLFFGFLYTAPIACTEAKEAISAQFVLPSGERTSMLTLEVADTPEERALGLMYRKSLPDGTGMIFVFPNVAPRSFWMKNTYIPLDIIYLSEDLRVVSIVRDAKPLSESGLPSEGPAKYVVELRAGASAALKLDRGATLSLESGDVLPPGR